MAGRGGDAEFGVLGPLEVSVGGRAVTVGSAQLRMLLAALVVQRGAVVAADRLVEVVWGDQLPPGAGGGLTKVVYRLRTVLAGGPAGSDRQLIVTRSPGYVLDVPAEWVDAGRFERLLRQAQATRRGGDHPGALRLFDEALGLWRGPALVEFAFEEFARGEAARLDELRLVGTEEWVEVRLALGDHERLVGDLEVLVGAHPFRERLWAQLMLALYRAERHPEALRAFGRLRGLLGDELGIEPSASLRSLEEAILLQKPELDWQPASAPAEQPAVAQARRETAREGSAAGPGAGSLAGGLVTFVFTDIEGSTSLWERHPAHMGAVLARHDQLVSDVVRAEGGQVFKTVGDAVHAVFAGPVAAVRAALAVQAGVAAADWSEIGGLAVRIGIYTGEAQLVEGEWRGRPLNRCARLRDAAAGGQILVSEATTELVGDDLAGQAVITDLGEQHLRGVTRIERAHLIQAGSARPVAGRVAPSDPVYGLAHDRFDLAELERRVAESALPADLATVDGPFVGRGTELGWLEVLWDRTVTDGSHLALLAGDTGMGKTRLAAHFARRVHAGGALVVYANCDDGRSRPFRPAGQALLRAITTSPGGNASKDGDTPRVVEEALAELAGAGPVLVVLDDLDRAGPEGLAVVERLASTPSPAPVLVVGLSRQELPGLQSGAGAQPRNPVHWRQLPGLSVDEVADLLAVVAGERVGPDLAAAVHAETGGNPSVVAQFARRRRDDDIAGRVEEAMARADTARQGLQSVHDVIANGVLHHGLRHPGSDTLGAAAGRCPYKGLARFEPADADYFCGRERLVAALIARLAVERFVAVIGASGSGKSSLLGAGLLPALAGGALPGSERWPTVVFRPGRDPRASAAAALAGLFGQPPEALRDSLRDPDVLGRLTQAALGESGRRLVLVVDQFEEVFTACRDPQAPGWLAELIVGSAADVELPIAAVLAVRADYVGACTAYPELAALVAGSQLLIGAMSDTELRRAVTEPARRVGLAVEDSLVDAVCRDGRSEPGALPLVSTALLETWARRHDDVLTLGAYLEAGGVRGALARLGEEAYQALSPADQHVARRILLRLAEPGAGLDDVRRRAPRAELDGIAGAEAVLAVLVARRLITADDTTVEVAHEALLREWPRARAWLEDDREGRRRHRHLTEAAAAWQASGQDPAGLYRGTHLAAAQERVSVYPEDANALELEFVDASLAEQDAELRSARRTARRLRRLSVGVALVAVVALLAGGVALVQRSHADQKAAAARRAATAADAGRLAARAQALPINQLDLAMLLAVQGRHLQQSATTDGALEAVLVHTPPGLDRTVEFGAPAVCAQLSLDGRFVASGTVDGYTHLIDVASGRTLRTFPNIVDTTKCPRLAFSADGNRLVACGSTGKVVVWDTATGRQIVTIKLPAASVGYAMDAFEPRPGRLVTATGDGTVILWDTTEAARPTRAAVFHMPATHGVFAGVTLADAAAPNRIAISNFDYTYVWNVATHTLAYPALPGRTGTESPDGSTIVSGTATQLLFWDVATGRPRPVSLAGVVPDPSYPPVFSADGSRLAELDRTTGSIVVVDLATRRRLASIPEVGIGEPGPFLKDGRLSVFTGQTMTLWRIGVTSPAPFAAAVGPAGTPAYAYFTPDGSKILTLGPNGLRTWDPTTGAALPPLLGGRFDAPTPISNPVWPSFSPDGALIAWGSRDRMVTLWDAASGQRLGAIASGTADYDVAWAPRGHVLAVGGPDGGITLWSLSDAAHPVRLAHMTAPGFAPPDDTPRPLFSPDGRVLAAVPISSGPFSDQLSLFDVSTGRLVRTIQTAAGLIDTADFSPDSRTLATDIWDLGSDTSRLVLWDLATGRARTTLFVPYVTGGVAFVAGGRWLAIPQLDTGAPDNYEAAGSAQVDLWDATTLLPTGEPLRVPGDAALLLETGLAPNRLALGTTSTNGTPIILDLDPAHWQTMACHLAGRNLTRAEWNQYLPGRPYQTTCPQWPTGT